MISYGPEKKSTLAPFKALQAEICTKTLKSVERETIFLIRYRYIPSRLGALLSSLTMDE